MKTTVWRRWGAVAPVAACAVALAVGLGVRGQEEATRAETMRKKLEYSKQVLEGLTKEDFPEMTRGARALKTLGESEVWGDLNRPEAERYGLYIKEFQSLAGELVAKADAKNLDGVTLAYVQLTVNCVRCHKELRESRAHAR